MAIVIDSPPASYNKEPQLSGEEKAEVSQAGKTETAVPAGKAPPAIVQHMMSRLGTHVNTDQCVHRRPRRGLTPRNQVWPRPAHGVLDGIGEEGCQDQGDCEAQNSDMVFVPGGVRECIGKEDEEQRDGGGVEHAKDDGDSLDLGVGE